MREILFRGKSVENGEWVYGGYYHTTCYTQVNDYIKCETGKTYGVVPYTVGQFTGLFDRNGNKIFEGDILKDEFNNLWLVTYELGAFCIINDHSGGTLFEPYADNVEIGIVFGNKLDNPELLNP